MEKQNLDELRSGQRTMRLKTNRREDMCMLQELDDVNSRTIADLAVKKQMDLTKRPTEEEIYLR